MMNDTASYLQTWLADPMRGMGGHPLVSGLHCEAWESFRMEVVMSEDKKYNGWTNYETWNLALWIGNEQGDSEYWNERAMEVYRDAEAERSFTKAERAALNLADELKNQIEENQPVVTGFYADVLSAAISEVNWYEIAEHWIDDVKEDVDAEVKVDD